MKKILFTLSLLLLLSSCGNKQNIINNQNTQTGLTENTQTGLIENTKTWILEEEEEDTFEEIYSKLFTETELINFLNETKNGDYLEEVPDIDKYSKKSVNMDYIIFEAIKNNDVSICEKLVEEEFLLCDDLYSKKDNKEEFLFQYITNYWEDPDFATGFFFATQWIVKWNCNSATDITTYLMCKKYIDLDFKAMPVYLKYSTLLHNKVFLPEDFYKEVSEFWWMDEWFYNVVENTLLYNIEEDEKL